MRCRASKGHGQPASGWCSNFNKTESLVPPWTCHERSNPTPWIAFGSGGKFLARVCIFPSRPSRMSISPEPDRQCGTPPEPRLILHLVQGKIGETYELIHVPAWAKPILAAVLKLNVTS
jgi:hypothetical protein